MSGVGVPQPEKGFAPYCDTHGCRGRWHSNLPHTLCGKVETRPMRCCCGALISSLPETPVCGACGEDVRFVGVVLERNQSAVSS